MIVAERLPEALERAGFGPVRGSVPAHREALGLGPGPLPEIAPREPKQVAEALSFASREHLACIAVGGGTELCLGGLPRRVDFLLSTARLSGIVDYPVGDLTITARAGTPLGHLRAATSPNRQGVPFDPPGGEWATLGGILAAASDGPRRLDHGAVRDQVLGITVAQPDGTIARAGGRVVKNVTGYDLGRLHTGAFGTLGVIVEATVRLRPAPRATAALAVALFELDAAASFLREFRASPSRPVALDLLDPDAAEGAFGGEFGVGWLVLVRFEGEPAALDAEIERLRDLAVGKAGRLVPLADPDRALLADPRRIAGGRAVIWMRASTVPSMVATFVERARREAAAAGVRLLTLSRAGVGTVHALVPAGEAPPPSALAPLASSIRRIAQGLHAPLVLVDAPGDVKRSVPVWGDPPGGIAVMRRLRERFDPEGALAPGRFVDGL